MTDEQKRFTLPELELFRAWYNLGAVEAQKCRIENKLEAFDVIDFYDDVGARIGTMTLDELIAKLSEGEIIDIYELLHGGQNDEAD